MTISEKVAYLKGLAEGLNIDTEKSKEGKLLNVIIGILEEIGMSIEDLEENTVTRMTTTIAAAMTTTSSRPSAPTAARLW